MSVLSEHISEHNVQGFSARIATSTPSYTAHPIAELKILRDIRNVAPSKNPAIPRC